MKRKLLPAVGFSLWALCACASEPTPRPARIDPSNPSAAESKPLTVGALAESAPPPQAPPPPPEPAKDQPAGAAEKKTTTYTCPMHPEITSDKPGRCPKCGMNLVPRTDAPPPEGKK